MEKKYGILAVDDSAFTLTIISTYLDTSLFEVIGTARNGAEALEQFAEIQPDVVLLDLVMPGLSGQETLQRLLVLNPGAKVVMVSSLGTEEAVRECLDLGAKSFLQKPFTKEDLVEFLSALVEGDGGAP